MSISYSALALIGLGACLGAGSVSADPLPDVPVDPNAEVAYQLDLAPVSGDWRLDPSVFTDVSPVSIPEVAIKLPEDQRDDG